MIRMVSDVVFLMICIMINGAFAAQFDSNSSVGWTITLPEGGCVGGKFDRSTQSYDLESKFCRHTGEEKWEGNQFCFCMMNKRDEEGNTLLHKAVEAGNADLIIKLRKSNVSFGIRNNRGMYPVDIIQEPSYPYKKTPLIAHWIKWQEKAEQSDRRPSLYESFSFHALVSADQVDTDALRNEGKKYYGINSWDRFGDTPLHILVKRPDATIDQVKAMINGGADPTIKFYRCGYGCDFDEEGSDVHTEGIRLRGDSGVETSHENSNQYFGNKKVMRYLFRYMVLKKLEEWCFQSGRAQERVDIAKELEELCDVSKKFEED